MKFDTIKSLLNELINFGKKPNDYQLSSPTNEKLKLFAYVLLIDIVACALIMLLISAVNQIVDLKLDSNLVSQMIKNKKIALAIFLILIVAPITEEFFFRFFLRFDKLLPRFIFSRFKINNQLSVEEGYELLRVKWDKYFRVIFYLPLIAFALIHIGNYPMTLVTIAFFPLLVLPQLVAGFLFAYIRIRLNFLMGVALHTLHNAIIVGIVIILLYISGYYHNFEYGEKYYDKNSNYEISIQEILHSPDDRSEISLKHSNENDNYTKFSEFYVENADIYELNEYFEGYMAEDSTFSIELFPIEEPESPLSSNKKYNISYKSYNQDISNIDTLEMLINRFLEKSKMPD